MHLTPWPPLLEERGKRGQGVKGVRCFSAIISETVCWHYF